MPELPEVETVKRVLEPQIQGLSVVSAAVSRPEVVAHPAAEEFCEAVCGQSVAGMSRRGKFLGIVLDSGDRIFLHLRMTGCLLLAPAGMPKEKHTHVTLNMSDGTELRFSDPRRFGRFWFIRRGETDSYSGMSKLGPEPFDSCLTADYLEAHFGGRKKAIKECLQEQSVIAGIGNIYADEILFASKIHPARPAGSLTHGEWGRLAVQIPEQLTYFICKNKISPEDYLKGKGWDYRNTPFLRVYGHNGEICPVCGERLARIVIGGRGSVFCPNCQR